MSEIANNSSNETTKLSVQVQKLREAVIRFADDLQLEAGDELKDVYKETQSLPAEIEALEERLKKKTKLAKKLIKGVPLGVSYVDYKKLQTKLTQYQVLYDAVGGVLKNRHDFTDINMPLASSLNRLGKAFQAIKNKEE